MSRLSGRFRQAPEEKRRYILDYTLTLSAGEVISSIAVGTITQTSNPVSLSPLLISSVVVGPSPALQVIFYASGGDDQSQWEVQFLATTSVGQIIEDVVEFNIESDL
jgi:hypothetical protein